MTLSMTFGLAIEFLTGFAFHGDLLYSTLISMSVAGMIGVILVEMLTVSESAFLLLVGLFLLIDTTMFCIRQMLQ